MSAAHYFATGERNATKWLLLGSLALNLFFIGWVVAMAIRQPPAPVWDRNVFVRVERLAATLPAADAAILRSEIDASRQQLDGAQNRYRDSQREIRAAIRSEPYNPEAVRSAMAQTRAARQAFDQMIQGVFVEATTKMSAAGRKAVADWPPGRNSGGKPR